MTTFAELGLTAETLKSINSKGFEEPTEIQALTIPLLLKNEIDIIAQAQTGTGKTAAFALPLLEKIKPGSRHTQAIIMCPTRELVIQVCEEINSLKGRSDLSVAPIYGGQSIELQLGRLRRGVAIVVGTPGRIIDHITRKTLVLDKIEFVILDEGDEMLNMGFVDDIELILEHTPKDKRVLLFSATMPDRIKRLAQKYMGPYTHLKTKTSLTTTLTEQIYFEISRSDKFEALCRIVDMEKEFYGIVFCRTKIEVDELTARLVDRGYTAEGLHGDISQSQREHILGKFRKKRSSLLIATDVAARGIDIINLTHVINYSLPQDPESYVHRIGRTGRAGNQGTAVTFVTPDEFGKLGFIKRTINAPLRKQQLPEIEHIIAARKGRISEEIKATSEGIEVEYQGWADELLLTGDARDVIAAVLKSSYGKSLDKKNYRQLSSVAKNWAKNAPAQSGTEQGHTRLFITKGHNDGVTKKGLIEFIEQTAGIRRNILENVEVLETFSFVTAPFAEAEHILEKFRKSGNRSFIQKAKYGDTARRGSRGAYEGNFRPRSSGGSRPESRDYHKADSTRQRSYIPRRKTDS